MLELRDIEVMPNRSGIGGPALEPALGVILRNPEAYTARFSQLLRPLFGARNAMSGTRDPLGRFALIRSLRGATLPVLGNPRAMWETWPRG